MITAYILNSIIISGFGYLVYLFIEFRNRGIGTSKRKDPSFPDVQGWPLLGQLPQCILDADRPWESGTVLASKLGLGVSITLPGVRIVDISKPEWIEYVQKTHFNNYVKGPVFETRMVDLFGFGTQVTDGPAWKRSRLAVSRIFHVNTFETIAQPCASKCMSALLGALRSAGEENRGLDFCTLFSRFNLELFIKMIFGKDLGLFEGKPSAEDFSEAFNFSQKQMDFRFDMICGWKLFETINYRVGSQMKSACHTIHDCAFTSIDEKLSKIVDGEDFADEETFQKDFLGLLMAVHHRQGHTLSREELRDDALGLLFAGRDATAQALSWCFFHLLMNPDIISRIREETSLISANGLEGQDLVTHKNYRKFTSTNASLLEAMRLHPPLPRNIKFALADDKIPGGPMIEAGDCVSFSDWQMARDPEIWGADCGQFQPDRWIDETGKMRNFGNFKFHAFNGGPRLCVGMNTSIFLAVKAIVEIVHNFDLQFCDGWLENVPKSEELEGVKTLYPYPQYRPCMTLPMKNPMMISVKARATPKF